MKYLLAIFILFLAAPAWAGDYTLCESIPYEAISQMKIDILKAMRMDTTPLLGFWIVPADKMAIQDEMIYYIKSGTIIIEHGMCERLGLKHAWNETYIKVRDGLKKGARCENCGLERYKGDYEYR